MHLRSVLTEINVELLLFLLLKSTQCNSTIQWQKEASRYVVTMATKNKFLFFNENGTLRCKK